MHDIAGAGVYDAKAGSPSYLEQLRVPHLSLGTYSIPAGGSDPQGPHSEDEVYVVTQGRATLATPERRRSVRPGDVLFVPAGEHHRFVDVAEDLCLIVVFGPAEHTGDPGLPTGALS